MWRQREDECWFLKEFVMYILSLKCWTKALIQKWRNWEARNGENGFKALKIPIENLNLENSRFNHVLCFTEAF